MTATVRVERGECFHKLEPRLVYKRRSRRGARCQHGAHFMPREKINLLFICPLPLHIKQLHIKKMLLKHYSAPLVPVFSFGEPDVYRPLSNPEDSLLRRFQETVRKITGISPMFPIGRGMFQYSVGVVPLRTPVTTVGECIHSFYN